MKAPDKIFILHHKDYSDRRIFNAFTEKDDETDIEYIRKDAVLEWAKEMKRICKGAEPIIEKAFQTMIDKIESL